MTTPPHLETAFMWIEREKKHKEETKQYKDVISKLLYLFSCQEEDEQNRMYAKHKNCKGFNKFDAHILTSIVKQYIVRDIITPKQIEVVQKRLVKYSKQFDEDFAAFDADAFLQAEKDKNPTPVPSKRIGGLFDSVKDKEQYLFIDDE